MTKQTLLLLTVLPLVSLVFSGCVERGYRLTSQISTHTVTAESSTNISDTKSQTKSKLQKMRDAVKKEHKMNASLSRQRRAQDTITEAKEREKAEKKAQVLRNDALRSKVLEKNILKKQALEEKKYQAKILKNKREEMLHAEKIRQLEAFKAQGKASEQKALEAQIIKEKIALQKQKIEKENALASQKALEEKNTEALRKAQMKEEKALEEKRLEKVKSLQAQRAEQIKQDITKREKATKASTQKLNFMPIDKIYHKFGTSEIHGHVIYLDSTGQETTLGQSKVYLLPISAKMNHWFKNYYLKNENDSSSNDTTANYLNSTYLNLSKNFEFYGVAEGSYYIIIEADYPSSTAKNKKVYIAKKIKVGKHKKIMAVFSKKL